MNPDTVRRLLATRIMPPPAESEPTWGEYLQDLDARLRAGRRRRLVLHSRTLTGARFRRHSRRRAEDNAGPDRTRAA